jgi:hypothetical protein
MPGSRTRTEHHHVDDSYWAGPGLVRMVCKRCRRVSVDLSKQPTEVEPDQHLGVDCLAWLTADPVR